MLSVVYWASRAVSLGSTRKRCTKAGYMLPTTTATKAHSPTASTGSTQPRRRRFTTSSTTANSEMSSSSRRAGSRAFTSV